MPYILKLYSIRYCLVEPLLVGLVCWQTLILYKNWYVLQR